MERVSGVNLQRVEWCCRQAGVALDDVAADLGISATTLARAREGGDAFTFRQLKQIAAYFGRGALFFLETGPVDEGQVYTPQFRTIANQKPEISPKVRQLIQRAERQRDIYQALREALNEEDRPKFNPPRLPANARDAAREARRWLKLERQCDFESYRRSVEAQGVLVFRSNGYSGKWQIPKNNPVLGFNIFDEEWPLIVVKKEAAETRQTFTLMHELGHVLLHKSSSIDDEADIYSQNGQEREANAFAGYLLVPDEFLNTVNDAERPADVAKYDEWLDAPRRRWGVSGEVILRRLLESGRLTQPQYEAYKQWRRDIPFAEPDSGSRMYRHREPKHIFGDAFVRTVFDALNARHITLAKASNYLDSLKIVDLHKLEQHYAGN